MNVFVIRLLQLGRLLCAEPGSVESTRGWMWGRSYRMCGIVDGNGWKEGEVGEVECHCVDPCIPLVVSSVVRVCCTPNNCAVLYRSLNSGDSPSRAWK